MSEAAPQADIERYRRLYLACGQISRALLRSRSTYELLKEVERILVDSGKFAAAAIASHDQPTVEAGNPPSATFPILLRGLPWGVLRVHSPGILEPDEVEWLQQVALDVSFAMERLELEASALQAVRVFNIGIFDLDHRAGTIYWSPQQREICGLGPDEPVSFDAFLERVHPADKDKIAAAIQRSRNPAGDGLLELEHRLILQDGSIRWLSARSQTFFEGEGEARRQVRTIGAVRDITARKQAEEEQKKLATIVAMNRDFIGIATLDGRGVYLNRAGMNLVGLNPEDVPNKTIFDFFAEVDLARLRHEIMAATIEGGYWWGETRMQHFKTGALIDMEVTGFQIRDDDGSPLYLATVARDITERKRAEAEKAKLEQRLFQAQKMESIGRLAGGVAHDFNNLLTVINGYSALALDALGPEDPLRATITEINKAGERAAALTRQLLAFSRKQILQPRVLDLDHVIEEMRPMLERLVGDQVEVRILLEAGKCFVSADPHQLEQVILNLALNARDAMPAGGRLLIETGCVELDHNYTDLHPEARTGPHVMLAVSDSGLGMDPETRQHIFEPFFTTKPLGQGTGLGLSTVQGVVAQSGGHINVYSDQGRGTTFKIYLPASPETPAAAKKPAPVPAVGGQETILVVEDLAEVRRYTAAALESYGYRVLPAGGAGEALRIWEQEGGRIHMVLTDLMMPDVSGRELANRLQKLRPGIKLLFMSGYTDKFVGMNAILEEHFHFIEKPFRPEELARKVRGVLGPPPVARILVADDEPGIRLFLRTVLERAGYEVVEAADGKQALLAARAERVDLVITDLVMPEQEGIETIRALRRELPDLKMIAISGAFGGQFLKLAQMLGADAVLSKPVRVETLLSSVESALAGRRGGHKI